MALNNAKHIVSEIDGVRCTIVETNASVERAAFLRQLLEFNNLEVKEIKVLSENSAEEAGYIIGVTNLLFNPVFAVYDNSLKTPEGGYVTPGYWNQECVNCDPRYWMRRKSTKKN